MQAVEKASRHLLGRGQLCVYREHLLDGRTPGRKLDRLEQKEAPLLRKVIVSR